MARKRPGHWQQQEREGQPLYMARKKNAATGRKNLTQTHRARKGKGFGHPASMNSKRPQSVRPIPAVEGQETLEEGMMNAAFADEERNAEHDLARETDFVNADTEHPDPGRSFRSPEISMPPGFIPNITLGHQGKSIQNQEQVSTEIDGSQPPAGQNQQNRMPGFLSNIIPGGRLNPQLISSQPEWRKLQKHAEYIESTHLRDLLKDAPRCDSMFASHDGMYLDYARQRATLETMDLLYDLAERADLRGKIDAMTRGDPINFTEERSVLHTALRATKDQIGTIFAHDGLDAVKEVHEVLDSIHHFTDAVRSGEIVGYTGKRLRNIVSVGIGGSYLGPEFLHEVLKTEPEGINSSLGYSLRFLANVDPVDVERTCADLDPEETLIVIVSKTFVTAETMLNARTMRQWLWDFMGNDKEVVRKHVVACSSVTATDLVRDFGIDTEKYFFRFWDWVGGRYSVCGAAGAVPISLLYGYDLFAQFLDGAHSVDEHFIHAPFEKNLPVLMALLGVWNMSFLGYNTRATLPYAEALLKFPAHIQQLDMESNGKTVTRNGIEVDYPVGEVDFGEPGTNSQHSFFQLLHMGQTVACDFIGLVDSQHDLIIDGEELSAHDEMMANFFAQPDALANGKTMEEVRAEGMTGELGVHRVFKGNRPSMSLLFPKLTAYTAGQLLAIYEHRTAVQGFIWDINSFDQWGVELGKKLALDVKDKLITARKDPNKAPIQAESPATSRILNYYVEQSREACPDLDDANIGLTSIMRKTHREHCPPPEGSDLGGNTGKLS